MLLGENPRAVVRGFSEATGQEPLPDEPVDFLPRIYPAEPLLPRKLPALLAVPCGVKFPVISESEVLIVLGVQESPILISCPILQLTPGLTGCYAREMVS